MHSLENKLKLEYVRITENVNHTIYVKLFTAYLANTPVSKLNTL